jgi:hypothetical protein
MASGWKTVELLETACVFDDWGEKMWKDGFTIEVEDKKHSSLID